MHTAYNFLIYIHVSIGFISLILFWVPIGSRKGSPLHVGAGRWYANAMYVVAFSAMALALLVMADPIATKHALDNISVEDLSQVISKERQISLFLLAISFLVLSNIRHGLLTLKAKKDHSLMRAPSHLVLNGILVSLGITLVFSADGSLRTLFYIFAGLCISIGIGNLRYCLKKEVAAMEWMVAHMGAMIGAGIGSYTAFFVFGGNRFLSEIFTGQLQLIPWVAPGVIGGVAITWLSRKYRNKFRKVKAVGSTIAQSST